MKRFSLAALLSLLLCILLAGAALAQVRLEPKHPEGRLTFVTSTRAQQTLTIAGFPVATGSDSVVEVTSTVGPRMPDGTTRARMKTDALQVRLSLPMGLNVEFDSAKPAKKPEIPGVDSLFDMWSALSGSEYTVVYGKDNRVAAVEGLEPILQRTPPAALDLLKSELDAARLRETYNQELARIPDEPVKPGDRWTRTEKLGVGGGQTLTFDIHYEYLGTVEKDGKTLDRIGVVLSGVRYELAPNAVVPLKVENSSLNIASSSGTLLFDRERGTTIESSSTAHIKGSLTFSANGMQIPGEVDLTLERRTSLKK